MTVRIKVKTSTDKPIYTESKKVEPVKKSKPFKERKGLIWNIVDIVYNDIRYFPNKILGRPVVKTMLSKDTWEDWEGQL